MSDTMKIANISVPPRKRGTDPKWVETLAASIEKEGLINPITLNTARQLIAGAHRLEACRSLGWEKIEVNIKDVDDIIAELMEIDENLMHRPLSKQEEIDQLARRKELWEAKEEVSTENRPKPKSGRPAGFASETAEVTGKSKTQINDDLKLKDDIEPEVWEEARPHKLTKTDLGKVAKSDDQAATLKDVVKAKAESLKPRKPKPKTEDQKRKDYANRIVELLDLAPEGTLELVNEIMETRTV